MNIARHRRSLTLATLLAFIILVLGAGLIVFGESDGNSEGEDQGSARLTALGVDLAFVRGVTRSHRSAVAMTNVARRRGGAFVSGRAADIAETRRGDISLLSTIGERLVRDGARPGSLDVRTTGLRPSLQELRQVKVFDRAFIDMMVAHDPDGAGRALASIDPAARRVAEAVLRTQTREIIAMNDHRRRVFGGA